MIGGVPQGPGWRTDASDERPYRRVVLKDYRGLHAIVGRCVAQPDDILMANRGGEQVGFSLIAVKPRMYLYREITPPPTSGRLGDFHPSQR